MDNDITENIKAEIEKLENAIFYERMAENPNREMIAGLTARIRILTEKLKSEG